MRYLSNQAVVYQSVTSGPRSDAPKAWLGMNEKSRCEPPRMMISPLSMPAWVNWREMNDLPSGSGSERLGLGGRLGCPIAVPRPRPLRDHHRSVLRG